MLPLDQLLEKAGQLRDPALGAILTLAICLYPLTGWYAALQSRLSDFDKRWVEVGHSLKEQKLELTAECRLYSNESSRGHSEDIADLKSQIARLEGIVSQDFRMRNWYDLSSPAVP